MTRDDPPTTSDVHDALASQFARHSTVRRLHAVPPHEVYEVRADGRRAVCKADTGPTGSAGTEGRVLAFVGEHTSVPVPDVLAVGDDHFVAAWHPEAPAPDDGGMATDDEQTATGDERTPDEEPPADGSWARAAGRGLATLHDETDPLLDGYGRFRPDGPNPTDVTVDGSPDWHAAALDYVRRHRPVLARHGHADVADAVRDALADRPDALDGAGDPVCCHGWATPEHVAVADGRVRCLVDFEHAMAAPGEFDYWRTVTPTFGPGGGDEDDAGRADRAGAREAFREGYESVRSLPDGLDRRRPVYAALNGVYYFESLYVQDRHGPEETEAKAAALRERVLDTVAELP